MSAATETAPVAAAVTAAAGPLARPTAPAGADPCGRLPYPGLRPFRSDESDIFFGRETQTDEMVERLKVSRFLAVVGTSGCGKSSLVRAGLVAALETGLMGIPEGSRWSIAIMRPGSRPISRLARRLYERAGIAPEDEDRDAGLGLFGARLRREGLVDAMRANPLPERTNLLVVVDQFEEVFRFRREGERLRRDRHINEADDFVAMILEATRQREIPIFVVLTMRSDFLGDCALFADLPEAINESQYLTPRLSREQRRLAIVGPARCLGGDVEPELVTRLLNETNADPDLLPVLQHLLMRMWTSRASLAGRRRPILLTMDDYERVGGMSRALSCHADEIYGRLTTDEQRRVAGVMFRRLSEAPANVRRPTEAEEIRRIAGARFDDVLAVANAYRAPGVNFLMPDASEPIEPDTKLDISHESLIKRWQRLHVWAGQEARAAETYREIGRRAEKSRRGEGDLLTGLDLQTALSWKKQMCPSAEWAARYGGEFGPTMDFLKVSAAAANRDKMERETARRRQVTRLRWTVGVFAFLFVLSVVCGLYALHMQRAAAEQQALALAGQADRASAEGDVSSAIVSAVGALPSQARLVDAVRDVLAHPFDRLAYASLGDATDSVLRSPLDTGRLPEVGRAYANLWARPYDPDRYRQFAATAGNALRVPIEPDVYRAVRDWLFRPEHPAAVAALERGVLQPVGSVFGTGREQATITGIAVHGASGLILTGNDQGQILGREPGTAGRWSALHPQPGRLPPLPWREMPTAAQSGDPVAALRAPPARPQQVSDLTVSRDRSLLLVISNWEEASLRSLATGAEQVRWFINRQGVPPRQEAQGGTIAISADPRRPGIHRILTASYRTDAALWEWDEREPNRPPVRVATLEDPDLKGHQSGKRTHDYGVTTIAFSDDGRRVATGSWDGSAKVWDAATGDPLFVLLGPAPVRSVRFSPTDASRLVTAGHDKKVRLWCTRTRAAAASGAAAAGDGRQPPMPCDGPDAATRAETGAQADGDAAAEDPAAAADGQPAPRARPLARPTWIEKLEPLDRDALVGHSREVISAEFDPTGERVASAALDGTVRLWDIRSGELQDVLQGPVKVTGRLAMVRFVDDRRVAASFSDARTFVWPVAGTPLRPRRLPTVPGVVDAAVDAVDRRLTTLAVQPPATDAGGGRGSGDPDRTLEFWTLGGSGGALAPVRMTALGGRPATRMLFSPDGRLIATVAGTEVDLWTANVWRDGGRNEAGALLPGREAPLATLRHGQDVLSVTFDADGRRILTTSADGTARLWNGGWDAGRRTLPGASMGMPLRHRGAVLGGAFSPDGKRIVTYSADASARLWDARTTQPVGPPLEHAAPVDGAIFDDEAATVVSVAADGRFYLWSARDGRPLNRSGAAPGYDDPECRDRPTAIAFLDADTVEVARSGPGDGACAWTWAVAEPSADPVRQRSRPISRGHLLAINDNRLEVFSRGSDDVPIARLSALRDPLSAIVVSPSGGTLAALYGGGQIRVLSLPGSDPRRLIRYARNEVLPVLADSANGDPLERGAVRR